MLVQKNVTEEVFFTSYRLYKTSWSRQEVSISKIYLLIISFMNKYIKRNNIWGGRAKREFWAVKRRKIVELKKKKTCLPVYSYSGIWARAGLVWNTVKRNHIDFVRRQRGRFGKAVGSQVVLDFQSVHLISGWFSCGTPSFVTIRDCPGKRMSVYWGNFHHEKIYIFNGKLWVGQICPTCQGCPSWNIYIYF